MRPCSSWDVSNSRKPQSTLGGRDKRRKWGSQSPRRAGSLGRSQNHGVCARAKKERQWSERVEYTGFFCFPISQSSAGNYHSPRLIRNQPTGKPSKGSPEKSVLLPEHRDTAILEIKDASLSSWHIIGYLSPSNSSSILEPVTLPNYKYICQTLI